MWKLMSHSPQQMTSNFFAALQLTISFISAHSQELNKNNKPQSHFFYKRVKVAVSIFILSILKGATVCERKSFSPLGLRCTQRRWWTRLNQANRTSIRPEAWRVHVQNKSVTVKAALKCFRLKGFIYLFTLYAWLGIVFGFCNTGRLYNYMYVWLTYLAVSFWLVYS